jgi:hypothetical protein
MKSYLLSALRQTFSEEEFRAFARSKGHHWLLWEPGGWTRKDAESAVPPGADAPMSAEALVLVLAHKSHEDQVTLGRSASCDLTINDGTLSQSHLVFMYDAKGWTVRDTGSTNGSWINGQKLLPGEPAPLANGSRLQAGMVHLTHYEPEGLWERLKSK